MDKRLRDALLALSLANLAVMGKWQEIMPGGGSFFRLAASQDAYIAVLLLTILLAIVVWGAIRAFHVFAGPRARVAAQILLPILVAFLLRRIYIQFAEAGDPSRVSLWVAIWGPLIFVVGALVSVALLANRAWRAPATRATFALLLILTSLVFVTAAHATGPMVDENEIFQRFDNPAPAPFLIENASQPRVLWIIFDEMDDNFTFDHRPASVDLPAFDALAKEAFRGADAYPPADNTLMSVPAMTTGLLVQNATAASATELRLQLANGTNVSWNSLPTVFSQARALGVNTGIMGWYEPYCRLFHQDVTWCHWLDTAPYRDGTLTEDVLGDAMRLSPSRDVLSTFEPTRALGLPHQYQTTEIQDNQQLLRWATHAVSDARLRFVYLHFNTPHPVADGLGFYSRAQGDYSTESTSNYLDNLALTDHVLGELRKTMEESGTWNSTTVIVTADESYRKAIWGAGAEPAVDSDLLLRPFDHRVPFLVKLPDQTQGVVYEKPFNTLLIHDLVLARLRGEITTPAELAVWVGAHTTLGESPYYTYEDGS